MTQLFTGLSRDIADIPTIGVFLLWFGWYGFNGGSVLSADPGPVSFVFVTTTLAAASGVIGAMTLSWLISKKPDLSMVLNGSLAGLVGITAGADVISPMNAVIVGYIAGLLVVASVIFFDQLKMIYIKNHKPTKIPLKNLKKLLLL